MKAPSTFEQLKSILALPFMVLIVVPAFLYLLTQNSDFKPLKSIQPQDLFILGMLFFLIGLPLFLQSVNLFIKIGKGTLAPWNPTKKLVVKGLYRYMRNPMITGVFCFLIAEALWVPSVYILFWALTFLIVNHFYFVYKEEPELLQRFGGEYRKYRKHVPRWIPRLKGWRPENQ
jgi:protein-S-isoprenylcysteine O-methyltransferase Ste14